MTDTRIEAVSYGGGVQSNALLALRAAGRITPNLFLFANVGEKAEHPATLRYVREVAMPFAEAHGIELVELHRKWKRGERAGQVDDLLDSVERSSTPSIPVRRVKDGPPMSRSCTVNYKIRRVSEELKRRGATVEDPALVMLGISVDEIGRAKSEGIDPRSPVQDRAYPLLALGLSRTDCIGIIREAGLPVPQPSSCWFCPFHSSEAWRILARENPELFARACEIEASMSARSMARDGRPVFLTRRGVPLDQAIDTGQMAFEGMDGCDGGWCGV